MFLYKNIHVCKSVTTTTKQHIISKIRSVGGRKQWRKNNKINLQWKIMIIKAEVAIHISVCAIKQFHCRDKYRRRYKEVWCQWKIVFVQSIEYTEFSLWFIFIPFGLLMFFFLFCQQTIRMGNTRLTFFDDEIEKNSSYAN